MVEESVPTFEAYCKHVDAASLSADHYNTNICITKIATIAASGKISCDLWASAWGGANTEIANFR
jgi:hypothetical protein